MNKRMNGFAALAAVCLMTSLTWASARQTGDMDAKPTGAMNKMAVSAADKKFAMKAAQADLAEIQAGKLATEKAAKDEWKQYGQKMIDDHTAASDKLKPIAEGKGITLPTSPNAKDAATIARLSKLNGAAFDRAYAKFAHASHIEAEKIYTTELKTGKDADIKQFAAQILPTVKNHHKIAMQLAPQAHPGRMKH